MALYTTTARANNVAIAPRKVGEVVALIRGRTVAEAIEILEHVPRKAALPVSKLVKSVAANATNNHHMDADTLIIKEITVGGGTRLKRFRPASRGRALPYTRQRSNILIRVEGEQNTAKANSETASDSDDKKTKTTKSGVKVSTTKTTTKKKGKKA